MSIRYALNTVSLLAGVFLLVVSRTFTGPTLEWSAFGVSAGVLAAAVVGIAAAEQRRHLAGFGALALAGAWSAVAALVYSGSTLGWLVFADAALVGLIALGSLAIHEVTTERVVHTLEVRDGAHQAATV